MDTSFIENIFKGVNLSETEIELAINHFIKLHVAKGKIILSTGQFVPHQYYVSSGCLRSYYLDHSGKEHNMQFAVQDWWISDYASFYMGGQSILYIECIQDSDLYQISKDSMEMLYLQVPAIETFFRIKLERYFASFQKRILSGLVMSATDKYKRFVREYPQIEQVIKNFHLASYLGITTESLSRIRKELAQH
jgi:CRP-like cAMP-binding protein